MRIIRMTARNIKRLRAVEITPAGNTVIVGGQNGEGKTSVIDSIAYGLAGKGAIPPEPVRRGERKGEVILELDDLIVTRRLTKNNAYLEVTTKAGVPQKSPQKILDDLVGTDKPFDPLKWLGDLPKMQLEMLKDLAGLDFTALNERRETAYAERKFANKELKSRQAERDAMAIPPRPDADGPVKLADLSDELRRRQEFNQQNTQVRDQLQSMRGDLTALRHKREDLAKQLEALDAELGERAKAQNEWAGRVAALQDEDEEEIIARIENAEEINAAFRTLADAEQKEEEIRAARKVADEKTEEIESIDAEKQALVAAAKMPIDGLGIGDDCVTLHGLPFSQASSAEQLRTAVAIALALCNRLKVVLIRDGSLLDETSMALLQEMIDDADAQLWIEVVTKDDPAAVIIEDGLVKRTPKA